MVYVSRKEHFNAAHRVFNPAWDAARNTATFGPCANPYYHGHNFELVVTACGLPHPETGFVVDLKRLGDLIRAEVIDALDHRNLNEEVPFLAGKIPTCEVLVMEIWQLLAPRLPEISDGQARLHSLKLVETPKNYVEYFG